ncbi:hypothetical protein EU527_05490 [Candidatus Thorarchaeota archaeon]|nr:MAG: hypothetical protein EU527_05490 [Candidatus Thorarchaeota archaeon]
MRVQVKLYATLREYAAPDNEIGASFEVQLIGNALEDLFKQLGFGMERAKIVMINGGSVVDLSTQLNEDDLVLIFPPVGGGVV